jgi:hypothetical protein
MSLVRCGECGRDVSDQAAACPNCGAPPKLALPPVIEDESRNKFLTVVFVSLFALVIILVWASRSDKADTGEAGDALPTERVQMVAGGDSSTVQLLPMKAEALDNVQTVVNAAAYNCTVSQAWAIYPEPPSGAKVIKAACSDGSVVQVSIFAGRGFVKPWSGVLG